MSAPAFLSSALPPHIAPLWRSVLTWGGRLLLGIYFVAALLILAGRHFVMPEIAGQRELIEQRLSAAIGLPVKMAAVSASWPGLHPHLTIDGLQLHDAQGRPALAFDRVEVDVGWSSLWHLGLRLHRIEITAPSLNMRRAPDGTLFVAGLPMQGEGDGGFADWLLKQGRVVIRDARIVWHDELRGAPPLELQHLHFDLRNAGRQHNFGLLAQPPAGVAAQIDLRGSFRGGLLHDLSAWRGELYANLTEADLSTWTPWLDLPLEWTRGHGGLRVWLNFAGRQVTGVTADLRLADTVVRLDPGLPILALDHLAGRLVVQHTAGDGAGRYVGRLQRFSLATQSGIELPPTDVRLALQLGKDIKRHTGGEFHADGLDLGALTALASHLPFPAELHARLRSFSPRGRLADFSFDWRGPVDAPTRWQVKGRFDALALAAYQELPGFAGISGRIEGDEKNGELRLDSHQVRIELPTVFPEPTLVLESLEADAGWRARAGGMDLLLARVDFRNADAIGEAAGSYRYTGQGLGEIDLSAKLTQAAGNAVWRYMPLVVNKDTRDWLRASIVGGRSASTSLRLKGPLAQFPFRDGKGGIFQVKGSFQGATLNYAEGWPAITNIDGELLFEGVRMLIRGQRAGIMGVGLSGVRAEIADLEAAEELLVITGQASGETQRFLDFIEASPVGKRIDHFTQSMTAAGRGELNLKLVMPLRHIDTTEVQGRYRFANNQLLVLPDLPPFTGAQGEFSFTADRLQAKNLRAQLLGMPLTLEVASVAGGGVRISADGKLSALALRQAYGLRALEHLAGESPWRGVVTVKKPGADIQIESQLAGLSSSLPDPFNKSVRTALPLKVVGRIEAGRDRWILTLADVAHAELQQVQGQWRGQVRLGTGAAKPAVLPARGVTLAFDQPRIDVDAWRAVLAGTARGGGSSGVATPVPLEGIDVRAAGLRLLGREFHDVRLSGASGNDRWRFTLDSREAQGQLNWDAAGAGRVSGRMGRLILPAADPAAAAKAAAGADTDTTELPAVDLVIDDFRLHDMSLGEVRINAENREGAWHARLEVKNEAAHLAGTGRWRPNYSAPETALNFKLDVNDAEKLLSRLGLPDAVRRGTGLIEGDVTWAGAPFALHFPSLSGLVRAELGKGQFKKLEPGVGRLLGVLSLQSLPRRITLDFRDIFSEGFAFDSIAGEAGIQRGLMSTEALNIRGPAAKIMLSGRANLVAETQDLKVRVQPAVGESIAVGAMIANPVVGAMAWLAQKALNDPLDQAFAYEYAVTGSWADPKVEKISRSAPESSRSSP